MEPRKPTDTIRNAVCFLIIAVSMVLAVAATSLRADQDGDKTQWRDSLLSRTQNSIANIEEYADVRWRRFADDMGIKQARHIAAYGGYGNREHVWVRGRLLANRPVQGPMEDDNWWENLSATYQRWESDEIPGATILLEYGNQRREVVTDSEGYYEAVFDLKDGQSTDDAVVARHPTGDRTLVALHRVYIPPPDSEFMVISDMDDTVIHTGITDLLIAAQLTFLYNAKTRKPLLGVGELYQSLVRGSQGGVENPVFYVSNSAWNMFDLLRDFIDLNDLPPGPLLLRDIGLGAGTADHKMKTLRKLMRRFSDFPAVLVGDSGQHDASIYSQLAQEFPARIKAIYIRDVDPHEDSEYDQSVDAIIKQNEALGVPFLRVVDSAQIAEHATRIGLLSPTEVDEIKQDVEDDRQRETLAEETIGAGAT